MNFADRNFDEASTKLVRLGVRSKLACECVGQSRISNAPANNVAAILVTPAASASLWLQVDKAEKVIEAAGVVW
jgi:hypothetical protein